jgi:hydrogenase nickel incorporation protein HypA/HybF
VHERAVVGDLIRKATEVAAEQSAQRVVLMTVHVGALSHVDPSALPEQLEIAAKGTPVEGADFRVVKPEGDPLADPNAQDVVLVSVRVE